MFIVAAYIVVAVLIIIVIWAIRRRRGKKSDWSLKREFAKLVDLQQKILTGK